MPHLKRRLASLSHVCRRLKPAVQVASFHSYHDADNTETACALPVTSCSCQRPEKCPPGAHQTKDAPAAPAARRRCDVLGWARGLPGLAQREMARTRARSLAIGDGANDVAMIQARSCCSQ